MKISFSKNQLKFKIPATTSRGAYTHREIYLIHLEKDGYVGIGECAPLPSLSIENTLELGIKIEQYCTEINNSQCLNPLDYKESPSFIFALESALRQIETKKTHELYETPFSQGKEGIPINGLIWMADAANMKQQIEAKLKSGFRIVKLKIGALDFDEECRVLEFIRKQANAFALEIRVDANGGFTFEDSIEKLKELSRFEIHSIEQPIKQGQWEAMHEVCSKSPVPVALDEELIGVMDTKEALLKTINPQYLILKPTLLGGFTHCEEWIGLANKYNKSWWATSALESNIGLNAIAQWVSSLKTTMVQGLGTGALFTKNYDLGLSIKNGYLYKNDQFTGKLI